MAIFTRILKNLGAMFTGRLLTIVQQIIIPPIFILRYSKAEFGEWSVLSGAVSALAMLNFGVQTFMNQDLAVRYAKGELEDYHVRQSTALRLLLGVVLVVGTLSLIVFAVPLDTMLKLDIGRRTAQLTAYFLALQVLLNFLNGYLAGIFMGVARAHRGAYWNNFQALLTALVLLGCVSLHLPFPILAGVQVITMSIAILAVLFDIRRTAPDIFPSLRYWDRAAVPEILKPSGYFGLLTLCASSVPCAARSSPCSPSPWAPRSPTSSAAVTGPRSRASTTSPSASSSSLSRSSTSPSSSARPS